MVAWATALPPYLFTRAFVEWQIPFGAKRVTQTCVRKNCVRRVRHSDAGVMRRRKRLIHESVIYDLLTKT